jgi:hypothetical protein
LDTGHLIRTHDVAPQGVQQRRIGIDGTNGFDLLSKGNRVGLLRFGIQPVAAAMGLKIGLLLKNGRPSAARWRTQSLV